jgi:hypothetical protein
MFNLKSVTKQGLSEGNTESFKEQQLKVMYENNDRSDTF